jgi:ureidoglycolate lyase
VSYAPDVWHHTLVALDRETDFMCFVWEDGSRGDCVVQRLTGDLTLELPAPE